MDRFRKVQKKRMAMKVPPPPWEVSRPAADMGTTELVDRAQEVASSVMYVSQHSGNLSGRFKGQLNTAALAFGEIVDALAWRPRQAQNVNFNDIKW